MTDGADNRWVHIELAALALGVSVATARVIAHRAKWNKTTGYPREYSLADIKATARQRKEKRPARRERRAIDQT